MARAQRSPKTAKGERVYGIGDVHGRLDLFAKLISLIRLDVEQRPSCRTRIVLVGDVIDRGPESAELVERLRSFQGAGMDITVLKGNHELMMVASLRGDITAFEHWLQFGGDATLLSWGVSGEAMELPLREKLAAARSIVPPEVIRWLDSLPLSFKSGDYYFVHAGVRPGVPLKRQNAADLLWISDDFLNEMDEHPAIIVHGHTIFENGPHLLSNRISLDTGAYRTGRLSAVGLERDQRWTITT